MRFALGQRPARDAGGVGHTRGFGLLSAASLVSGLAGYGVIALGTRAVGEVLFAPVSIVWSFWALSVAAVSFPIQHWTIRSSEAHGEHVVWSQMPRILALVAGLSIALAIAGVALGTRLFPSSPTSFSVMVALLPLGSLAIGLQRGVLTYRRRFRAVALLIAGENGIRALATLFVFLMGDADTTASIVLGSGIIAGFGIALVQPGALRRSEPHPPGTPAVRASVRLLGGFAGANVAAQAALTSAPVILALWAVPESVITQVFAILALLRVPYTGFVGASAAATGPLSRLVDGDSADQVRRWEVRGLLVAAVLATTAFLIAPPVLRPAVWILFATDVTIPEAAQSTLAAGGVLAVANLLQMLVLLARRRSRRLLVAWTGGLAAATVSLLVPWEPVMRVSLAFLVAEGTALLGLTVRRTQILRH